MLKQWKGRLGRTEGLEPKITQRILETMQSAKGGKLQAARG